MAGLHDEGAQLQRAAVAERDQLTAAHDCVRRRLYRDLEPLPVQVVRVHPVSTSAAAWRRRTMRARGRQGAVERCMPTCEQMLGKTCRAHGQGTAATSATKHQPRLGRFRHTHAAQRQRTLMPAGLGAEAASPFALHRLPDGAAVLLSCSPDGDTRLAPDSLPGAALSRLRRFRMLPRCCG